MSNVWRRAHSLLAVVLLGLMPGCSGVHAPLRAMDENQPIKTGSLAVISGSHRGGDVLLAELVTRQLESSDRFRVMSQQEIARRVPDYPVLIEMQDSGQFGENDEKAIWFSPAGKATLDAMRARLGVDYLLVLWVPRITRETPITLHGGQFFHVYPVGNLLEYPAGRTAAATRMHAGETMVWLSTRNKPSGERIDNLLAEAAEKIAASLKDVSAKNR